MQKNVYSFGSNSDVTTLYNAMQFVPGMHAIMYLIKQLHTERCHGQTVYIYMHAQLVTSMCNM